MARTTGKERMYGTTALQKFVYATKFCCHGYFRICLWRRLASRLIRLGVVRGHKGVSDTDTRIHIGYVIWGHVEVSGLYR